MRAERGAVQSAACCSPATSERTKTLLGLFSRAPSRPAPLNVQSFPTAEYGSLIEMVDAFLTRQPGGRPVIDAASFGVAGPVIDDRAELTNVGWVVDGREVAIEFGLASVHLLNDLVAVAHSISVLQPDELGLLQEGRPNLSGNAGLVAAGTGLGESYLFNDGRRLVPAPSEAGHSDFAARTPRELELSAWLIARYGRPELEQVVSGIGLRNLYAFTHPMPCADVDDASDAGGRARAHLAEGLRRHLPVLHGGAGAVRVGLRRGVRQPRAARGHHARAVCRRRHRAEDPAGAADGALPRQLLREAADA